MKRVKIGIAVGIVIAVIALVLCLVPLKEVAYAVTVDYQDTETYYEDEPYQDTETYYETEPYEDTETYYETEPLTFEVVESFIATGSYKVRRRIIIGGKVVQDEVVEVFYPIPCVTLQNTDSVNGTLKVQFTCYALDKFLAEGLSETTIKILAEKYYSVESLILESGEVGAAQYSIPDISIDEDEWFWEYEVTPGTKRVAKERTVTKYRQVEKERTVTKHRQVEKERTVTKQRPETHYKKVSLLEYLLHY